MKELNCFIVTYNEENRIKDFLRHATQWANNIYMFDKCSTDETVNIAKRFSNRLTVCSVEYSPQGWESPAKLLKSHCKDWCFIAPPGDIPTHNAILEIRKIIQSEGSDAIDAIRVPRKTYSFNEHIANGPWGISYVPCVVNTCSEQLSNEVHRVVTSSAKLVTIDYSEATHVLHQTHRSARNFLETHTSYALKAAQEDSTKALRESTRALGNLRTLIKWGKYRGRQYHAWRMYQHASRLAALEQELKEDISRAYQERANEYFLNHWNLNDEDREHREE